MSIDPSEESATISRDTKTQRGLFLILSFNLSMTMIVNKPRASPQRIFCDQVFTNSADWNISYGISEISAKISKFLKYDQRDLVLKNPSTIIKAKIGKAILPKMSKIVVIITIGPVPVRNGVIIALLKWSINIEAKAIYFNWAPFMPLMFFIFSIKSPFRLFENFIPNI